MEKTGVQKLARALRVILIVTFICNIAALLLVPLLTFLWGALQMARAEGESVDMLALFVLVSGLLSGNEPGFLWPVKLILYAWRDIWSEGYLAVLAAFLEACGVCTAVILWQAKRVLDTIIKGDPFTLGNAASLKRAAVCCWIISGAALVRLIFGFVDYRSIRPLFTYNGLFVPVFLIGGLLCMVMSALFRQAAELKAENDLTI